MTTYILLHKRTSEILEGTRISFMDNETEYNITNDDTYKISMISCDGWLVRNPQITMFSWYLTNKCVEDDFEILGTI